MPRSPLDEGVIAANVGSSDRDALPKRARRAAPVAQVARIKLSEAMERRLAAYAHLQGITRAVAIRRLIGQGLERS